MEDDNAIWFVAGAEHTARMARELAWIATGGQTGVVGPDSLEVTAQSVPSNTVQIAPGGMNITATSHWANIGYTDSPWQSYMRSIYKSLEVEIDPSGSNGARTDVVGIIVEDPNQEGRELSEEELLSFNFWRPYVVKNAGRNATRPEHFASLGRPFLPLAQVHLDNNQQTIYQDDITDIRFLAISRTETQELMGRANESESSIRIEPEDTSWVDVASFENVPVPQWATRCKLHMTLGPVYAVSGAANGEFRVRTTGENSTINTSPHPFIEPDPGDQVGGSPRFYLQTVGDINLHEITAGGFVTFQLQVRRTHNAANRNGTLIIPGINMATSRIAGRATFEEHPSPRRFW